MELPPELRQAPFTLTAAARHGVTRGVVRRWVAEGQVVRVVNGVYAARELPDTTELRAAALSLVVTGHAVVCDRTAAWLWGVDVLDLDELSTPPPVETFVVRGHGRVKRAECVGGERDLLPRDIVVVGGVRVTSPLRTALDLGCKLTERRGLGAMDDLMRTQGVTRAELWAELPRFRGRRWVRRCRRLVPLADPRAESQRESWVRLEMHNAGLPAPEVQWWVDVDGVPTYRLDLAYPDLKIAVEYDGAEHHGPEQRAHDERRRAWLRAQGWHVIVVRRGDFTGPRLDAWLHELKKVVAERSRA